MSGPATTSVVVFTRDLRVRDHPALVAAAAAGARGAALRARRRRARRALVGQPHGVPARLPRRPARPAPGARRGPGRATWRAGGRWCSTSPSPPAPAEVHLSADVSGLAQRREQHSATPTPRRASAPPAPGDHRGPAGGDRPQPAAGTGRCSPPSTDAGSSTPGGSRSGVPASLRACPTASSPASCPRSPIWSRARRRRTWHAAARPSRWSNCGLGRRPPATSTRTATTTCPATPTSRISAHLHFGCLSPLEVATRLRDRPGGGPFVRQLCWRDFYHQALAGRPETAHEDYRPRGDHWRDDPTDLAVWTEGRTGFPIVDAGMRQLRRRGVHAQPRPDDRRVVPHQGPVPGLARRRGALHVAAGRRRRRQQPAELAVDRRDRHRLQSEPDLQPDGAVDAVRPRRATTSVATCPSWPTSPAPEIHETERGDPGPRRAIRRRSSTTTRRSPPTGPSWLPGGVETSSTLSRMTVTEDTQGSHWGQIDGVSIDFPMVVDDMRQLTLDLHRADRTGPGPAAG